jgi:N-acetylmuramoyl-L-alanine amidase
MIPTAIVVHCSATRNGLHIDKERIDKWHRQRGFNRIGYHYVIYVDGRTVKGREDYEQGAHCKDGGMNNMSLGICMVGMDKYSVEQWDSLANLVLLDYGGLEVFGHNEFNKKKTCPGFNVQQWQRTFMPLPGHIYNGD